jgi:predicted TIM-barrel fold metal-dependent hydrolase
MEKLEIIDCHAHTFPTQERGTAFQRALGIVEPTRHGTIEELLKLMEAAGIAKTNMLMWTPAWFMYQELVKRLSIDPEERRQGEETLRAKLSQRCLENNEWALEVVKQHHDRLTFFAGIDPVFLDEETMIREIDDKLSRGAKGLKIAPVNFCGNDERLFPMYEAAQRWRVPVLSYTSASGFEQGQDQVSPGHPKHFEEPLKTFPNCTIIVAHLGAGAEQDVARLTSKYPNLYADVSARLHQIAKPGGWSREETVTWLRRISIDRILFGTNYPMYDPLEYVEVMKALPLTDEERHKILSENFNRLVYD